MTQFQTPKESILRGSPSSSNRPLTVPDGNGMSVRHFGGFNATRVAVISFSNTSLTVADNGGTGSGGLKIADFPEGLVLVLGAVADLSFTTSSVATDAAWVASLGTVTAAADGTLTGTEADVIPSTAAAIASSAGEFNGVSTAAQTILTDNSAGTANTTVQAMADPTDTPATADALRDDIVANLLPAIRNNVADLALAINNLIYAQQGLYAKAFNGTATPVDLYLNMASTNDPVGAETITINGKVQITYVLLGENPITDYA